MFDNTDILATNAIRALSTDMVDEANSGHPGLPLGAAPMAYALWSKHVRQNPQHSKWTNRDRFVLSAGHGSAMLYSLLHLSGYDLTLDDVKNFRQFGSKTPGHPEVHLTDGVEATTGPLGQGFANAVGMAMAEAHDAAVYNKDNFNVVDHYTYTLVGDGDLMEGISQEAASLAGHLKLNKLIALYDSNDISLDGPTSKAFTENVGDRFKAYGWEHILVKDGNDLDEINQAIEKAKENKDQPTLVEIKTIIGFGAKNQGTSGVHGAPLGADGSILAKENIGWTYDRFEIPQEAYDRFKEVVADRGQAAEDEWNKLFEDYKAAYPELAAQYERAYAGKLPEGWANSLPVYEVGDAAFPGGRVEAGEDFKTAAIRETTEELGLEADKIEIIGEMDYVVMGKRIIGCYVGQLHIDRLEDLVLNQYEVDHVFSVPLDDLKSMRPDIYYVSQRQELDPEFPYDRIPGGRAYGFHKPHRYGIHFYNIQEEHLWGMTAKLTARFIDILNNKHLQFNQ